MTLAKALQRRREKRARRELERAINEAPSPALRDELIIAAQRDNLQRTR